jgi:hypothetical protein
MYCFNELCIIHFSIHSFYASTANIAYLSFRRYGCAENKINSSSKLCEYATVRRRLRQHSKSKLTVSILVLFRETFS